MLKIAAEEHSSEGEFFSPYSRLLTFINILFLPTEETETDYHDNHELLEIADEEFVLEKISRNRTALSATTLEIMQRCFEKDLKSAMISDILGVSPACVSRRRIQFDSLRRLEPLQTPSPKLKITQTLMDEITSIVESIPTLTIPDILSYLSPEVKICSETCRKVLQNLDYSFKQVVDV